MAKEGIAILSANAAVAIFLVIAGIGMVLSAAVLMLFDLIDLINRSHLGATGKPAT